MELWNRIAQFILRLGDQYDDYTIFLLLLLEEAGVPLPTTGDMVIILAGHRVGQGKLSLPWVLVVLLMATLIGGSILYWVSARAGRPLVYRYGRYLRLDRARLDRAEGMMRRHAARAIILGRLIPGLRTPTVIAAGIFGVPYRTFLPAFALGSFPYVLAFVLLGMWVGPRLMELIGVARFSLRLLLTAAVFLGLGAFLFATYRRAAPYRAPARDEAPESRRLETSALAGLLATLEMAAGLSLILYGLAAAGVDLPEEVLLRFLGQAADRFTDGNMLRLLALLLAFIFASGLVWANLYSHVAIPLLPDVPPWLLGLLFSMLPLAFSALALMPLLGGGVLGLALGAGLLPLAGEMLRNALFGLGLAASYSLLRLARQPSTRAVRPSSP